MDGSVVACGQVTSENSLNDVALRVGNEKKKKTISFSLYDTLDYDMHE